MNSRNKNFLIGLIVFVLAVVILNILTSTKPSPKEIIYSDFLQRVQANQLSNVVISGSRIEAEMTDGGMIATQAPKDAGLIAALQRANVKITVRPDAGMPWYMSLLVHWGPFVLIIAVWVYLMRRMQGGGNRLFSLGKSRARRIDE